MLEMKKGCKVARNDVLCEQYQICENSIISNVNASKIEEVFQHFIAIQQERLFFILELPAGENDEIKLRKDNTAPMHKDIYYIDGLTSEQALVLLMRYGELLINDGLCQFGFGVHDNSAELMSNKYNVLELWTNNIGNYRDFFDAHDILQTEKIVTAWDTFSEETPGQCSRVEINGLNIFDLPRELADWGIYFAEQREE